MGLLAIAKSLVGLTLAVAFVAALIAVHNIREEKENLSVQQSLLVSKIEEYESKVTELEVQQAGLKAQQEKVDLTAAHHKELAEQLQALEAKARDADHQAAKSGEALTAAQQQLVAAQKAAEELRGQFEELQNQKEAGENAAVDGLKQRVAALEGELQQSQERAAADLQNERDHTAHHISLAEENSGKLTAELNDLKTQYNLFVAKVNEVNEANDHLKQQLSEAQAAASSAQAQVASGEQERAVLQGHLQKQAEELQSVKSELDTMIKEHHTPDDLQ